MKKIFSKLKNISFAVLIIVLIGFSALKSQPVYDTLYLFPNTTTFLNESLFIGGWVDNFAVRFEADSSWNDYQLEKILFQVPNGIAPHFTTEIAVSLGDLPEDSIISTINVLYDTIHYYPNISNLVMDTPIVINSSNHFFISGFSFFMTLTLGPAGFPILNQFQRFLGNWTEWQGSYFYLKVVVKKIVTDIKPESQLLSTFFLCQNFPNPYNSQTTISYSIPNNSFVQIQIFDVLGREISTLLNEEKAAGNYKINFNASELTSGVYFYRIQAGEFIETKKMILLK